MYCCVLALAIRRGRVQPLLRRSGSNTAVPFTCGDGEVDLLGGVGDLLGGVDDLLGGVGEREEVIWTALSLA